VQNRRKWVRGKIAYGLGELQQAEVQLTAARDGFMAEGIPYDTALAFFRQAVEAENATVELIANVAAYLRRAEGNPELRFGEGNK
jgi:hypothetical protein